MIVSPSVWFGSDNRKRSTKIEVTRAALSASTYPEALAAARQATGIGMSTQTFGLIPKIREVDDALSAALADRIVEMHPEAVFAALAGAPLTSSKHTAEGLRHREELLTQAIPALDGMAEPPPGPAADDVADALALLVCARAHVAGRTVGLGDGSLDGRGLPMRIVTPAPALD